MRALFAEVYVHFYRDCLIMETSAYTVRQYLEDISPLLTEKGVRKCLACRRLSGNEPVEEMEQRELDLAEAEVYYWLSNLPVGGNVTKIVDGNYSYSDGGWQVSKANIDEWRRKYADLRKKWGEEILSKTRVTLINL